MTKFKGRSSLKQYMPLKPTKRGIKMWMRCDSLSGYVYYFNIYCGKEDGPTIGTLGERVVNNLAKTIKHPDVTLCFDRFFTSVHLLETLDYPALGTVMTNRKNLPSCQKLPKGETIFQSCSSGIIYTKWHDTKEVAAISNFHCSSMVPINKLVMMSAVNSWIIYMNLHRQKEPFLDFLVMLAESLIAEGQQTAAVRRSLSHGGYLSKNKKTYGQAATHLPIEGPTRRRCRSSKKEN